MSYKETHKSSYIFKEWKSIVCLHIYLSILSSYVPQSSRPRLPNIWLRGGRIDTRLKIRNNWIIYYPIHQTKQVELWNLIGMTIKPPN